MTLNNMDILMTGYVAFGGISCILHNYEEQLNKELPISLIKSAMKVVRNTADMTEIPNIIKKVDSQAIIYAADEGGIYKALWDVAEQYNISGLVINLKEMMIKQEFVEISEYFNINPYMLNAKGVYIIITEYGNRLMRHLHEEGVKCALIGYTTDDNDRIVVNSEEIKYISSRIEDELIKLEGLKDERKDS